MILQAVEILKEDPKLSRTDVAARMQRHVCRCGTYPAIVRAIRRAAV
jgi:aerobic-type carbon monoxide dehydrogenase small subunit (CoxS/CutS family)